MESAGAGPGGHAPGLWRGLFLGTASLGVLGRRNSRIKGNAPERTGPASPSGSSFERPGYYAKAV